MTIFITGANGLLGQHLVQLLLLETEFRIIATGKGDQRWDWEHPRLLYQALDISNALGVHEMISKHRPDVVVHAAAMTQIDDCERNPIGCWLTNVTATRFLADATAAAGGHFVFISTDFVFDGTAGPYTETDTLNPLNYYGSSKWAGEKAVALANPDATIIRTCLVYGNILAGTRNNIISWVRENLEKGKRINVVADQWRTPTYVGDLAKGVLLAASAKTPGLFHISGEEGMSPFDMAMATAQYLHLDASLIASVPSDFFTVATPRPLRTGFNIQKAKQVLGYQPINFEQGLQNMLGKQ